MRYYTRVGEVEHEFEFSRRAGVLRARCNGSEASIDVALVGDGSAFSLIVDGRSYDCLVDREHGHAVVQVLGERVVVMVEDERERAAQRVAGVKAGGKQTIDAVMPGVVVDVKVAVGDVVGEGQTLVVLEAMKMQNPIPAQDVGRVSRVAVANGDAVASGAILVEIDPIEDA